MGLAGFTFYANRFDTDDVVYRLAKLGAMLAVAGLAASASEATGSLAGQFALCCAAIRVIPVALYLRAYRHVVQARGLIVVYLTAGALPLGVVGRGRWRRGLPVRCLGGRGCDRGEVPPRGPEPHTADFAF